jgi:hypothetical protein
MQYINEKHAGHSNCLICSACSFGTRRSCSFWSTGVILSGVQFTIFRIVLITAQRMRVSFCGENGASDFVFDYSSSFCLYLVPRLHASVKRQISLRRDHSP